MVIVPFPHTTSPFLVLSAGHTVYLVPVSQDLKKVLALLQLPYLFFSDLNLSSSLPIFLLYRLFVESLLICLRGIHYLLVLSSC